MRRLAVLLLLTLALPAAAARAVAFDVEATTDSYRLAGGGEPTLRVEAGDEVTLRFTNLAPSPHNLHVGAPLDRSTPCCQPTSESAELRFTIPADLQGGVPFWSDADPEGHRGLLLVGEAVPRVRIVEPADGADVPATFTVRVEVDNFVLEAFPAGNEAVEGRGHLRYLVDGGNASVLTNQTARAFESLPVGHHLVRVELVNRDGSPLAPPAFDEVLVYRAPASPTLPPGGTTTPTPPAETTPAPWPGVLAALAALATASRFRRPPR